MGEESVPELVEVDPLRPYLLEDEFQLENLDDPDVIQSLSTWQQGDVISGLPLAWVAQDEIDLLFPEEKEGSGTGAAVADAINGETAENIAPSESVRDGDKAISAEESRPGDKGVGARFSKSEHPVLSHFAHEPKPREDAEGNSLPAASRYNLGVITSQTCDIAATGPGRRHPVIQVSPLVPIALLGERAESVRQGKVIDIVPVPNARPFGTWAADLRISIPVSKGVLLEQERSSGFKNEGELLSFAEAVALKYWRPALHDGVESSLVALLEKFVKAAVGRRELWAERVFQFRLQVNRGTRLYPDEITILVLTTGSEFEPAWQQPLRKWRIENRREIEKACNGATLCPMTFERIEQMSLLTYRASIPLRIPSLARSVGYTLG